MLRRPNAKTPSRPPAVLTYLTIATVIGMALGAVMSMTNDGGSMSLPTDVIASVNGTFIQRSTFDHALVEHQRQQGAPLSAIERHQILTKLIDDELLFQAGMSSNAIKHDSEVLQTVIQAMTATIAAESAGEPPSDATLRQFYQKNWKLFSRVDTPEPAPDSTLPADQIAAVYRDYLHKKAYSNYVTWLQTKAIITVMPEFTQ